MNLEFRAWHIKRKKFYYNIERVLIEKQSGGMQDNNFGAWLEMEKQGKVVIETYIGKKDKNNTKIFKGDIIERWYSKTIANPNKGIKKLCVVEWNEHQSGFWFKEIGIAEVYEKYDEYYYDYPTKDHEMLVVGNIHENGGFLK